MKKIEERHTDRQKERSREREREKERKENETHACNDFDAVHVYLVEIEVLFRTHQSVQIFLFFWQT
jgi:hypothetical protein